MGEKKDEQVKLYISSIIIIPFLVTFLGGTLELLEGEWFIFTYFMSLISTHLVVSRIQELIK